MIEPLENRRLLTTTLNVTSGSRSYATLTDTSVTMTGESELHVTGTSNPIAGSTVALNSPEAWFWLDNVRPSAVNSTYLKQITVNGAAAVQGGNVRVVEYGVGTVVIPQSPSYQPFQAFGGPNFTGTPKSFGQYTYYNSPSTLGQLNQDISSFTLKRGYMATVATEADGGGVSKVYVAQDYDLDVALLPTNLDNSIQFVRVFPWRWVSKKGASDVSPTKVDAEWNYNWNNNQESTLDQEYVPIQQQPYWPGAPTDKQNVTEWLGFNEPNNPVEDAYKNLGNGSVDNAIAFWPHMETTGLRIGAPAVSDGGKSWLYDFMDKAIAKGLRVDFIPIHFYQQQSARYLYSWLKDVYDRYHLPIWVTEFNYGANWTGGTDPTYDQEASAIGSWLNMFDSTPWIERYSVYSNVEAVRQVTYSDGSLTPMGQVYHDHASPVGYVQQPLSSTNTEGRGIVQLPLDGNALDTSGYGNNAQTVGAPAYVAGRRGQAIQLDGASSYVQLPSTVAQGDSFSFAAWVYWSGGGNWQRIFDFGNDTSSYLFLTASNGSNLRFGIKNGGAEQIVQTTPLPVGQWTHVAVTLGGGVAKLYVNGSLAATNSAVTIKPSDFHPTRNYLGKSQFADPLFNGRLDDVHISDSVLTQAQIAGLMTDTPPQFTAATIVRGPASRDVPFVGTIAGAATDVNPGDTLTYSKADGPSWLKVAPDGTLSGTPVYDDETPQDFVVAATDSKGAMAYATLTIPLNVFYWAGDAGGSWNTNNGGNTNWSISATSNVDLGTLPDAMSDVIFAKGATVTLGGDVSVRSLTATLTLPVTIGGTNRMTIGAGGIDIQAGSAAMTIAAGQVVIGADQTWSNFSKGSNLVVSAPIGSAGTLTLAGGMTLSGALTGSGTLRNALGVTGAANVFLTGNLSGFSGTLDYTCDSGSATQWWRVGSSNLTADLSRASVVIHKGNLTDLTTASSKNFGFTDGISGATLKVGSLSGDGVLQASYNNSGPNALEVGFLNTSTTFSGVIAGGNAGSKLSLTKVGTGTLTLSGASVYSAGSTLVGGTILVGNALALGSGAVTLKGGKLSSSNASGSELAITNPIAVAGGGAIAGGAGTFFHVNGNLSGSGTLTLSATFNSAGLALGGDDSAYAGTIVVSGANTRLDVVTAGDASAAWILNGNLQTDVVGGGTFALGSLAGSGNVSEHAVNAAPTVSTLSVGALNTSTTFAGTIVDNATNTATTGNSDGATNNVLALTKVGTGTLTLSGVNTYTGATTVLGGTLALNASERVANMSDLTLAGGTFATGGFSETLGALTLSADSTIDFGAGASRLIFAGAGALASGSTLTLTHWTAGSDHLFVGTSAGLTADQLAQINFDGAAALQLSTGEIVPADQTPPTLVSAFSRKTQASTGFFDLPLNLDGAVTIEPRAGGPATLLFNFSEPVYAADNALDGNEFVIDGGTFSSATLSGATVTLQLTDVADASYVSVALQGLRDAAGNELAPTSLRVGALSGDVTGDASVDFGDLVVIAQHYNTASGMTMQTGDLNGDANVDFNDLVLLAQHYNVSLPAPPALAAAISADSVLAPVNDAAPMNATSRKPIFNTTTQIRRPSPAAPMQRAGVRK